MYRVSALFLFAFISTFLICATAFGVASETVVQVAIAPVVPTPSTLIQVALPSAKSAAKPPKAKAERFRGCPWATSDMVYVTMMTESKCNPRARGSLGEIGLGQIRYEVWGKALRDAGIIRRKADLWNPRVNARATAWILESLPGSEREKFRRYNGSGKKARVYADSQMRKLKKVRKGGII